MQFNYRKAALGILPGLVVTGVFFYFLIFNLISSKAVSARSPQLAQLSGAAFQERLQDIDEKLRNPNLLLLRNGEFDPLEAAPEPVRIGGQQLETTTISVAASRFTLQQTPSTDEPDNAYFIVQFRDRIRAEWADSLRARGNEIVGYVANNGYVVRVPRGQRNRTQATQNLAASMNDIRWVGAYGPGLKVETELVELADSFATSIRPDAAQFIAVSFVTFRGENSTRIRQAITQVNSSAQPMIEDRNDGRSWGVIQIAKADLPGLVTALARLEGIEWIEQRRPHRLSNDNGFKIIQSGTTVNDAPLYRKGLTGAGQIYGNADSGLDTDHAQFRLGGAATDQTLSFATTTQALVNGQLPFSITNPNNKVLVYYVLGNGSLLDNAANPNGGKVLDPNQQFGQSYRNSVAYDDNDGWHGTHTTSVAVGRDYLADGTGSVPGLTTRTAGDGVAPDARIVFQDAGHPSGELPGVDNISQLLIHQQAYNSGARVHNNSYGPAPPVPYDSDAADIDDVMWRFRDYTIFFSAGNDGTGTGQVASVAKNNIVVAATDTPTNNGNIEDITDFSNHGPTSDGRIKPDIAAPGYVRAANENTGIAAGQFGTGVQTSTTALDAAINPSAPNGNRSVSLISGTSFASPMAAGGGLLVRQYFTDGFYPTGAKVSANGFNPSNALVKAIILNSGRNMTGRYTASDPANAATGFLPNFGQGWGRMALDDALFFIGDRRELKVLADIWNGATANDNTRPAPNAAITTGVTHTYQLTNVSTVEPLRITLTWSDPKGLIGAQTTLVNNLDLEVTDPIGTVYRGNINFANAFSQAANGAAFDTKNPLEGVYIQYPQPGTYTVKVVGANVPGNGQTGIVAQPGNQTIDSNKQGYALIATGNFSAGVQSLIAFSASAVSGGVNADRFISRNETASASVTVTNVTVLPATSVNVQLAVDAASQVPANLVRINGQPAGQPAAISYDDLAALGASKAQTFQITLLNDGVNRAGQTITFNVTMTPTNGMANTTQFSLTVAQKIITYRTRFESTPDPGGTDIIPIPEADWGLRADNPNPAPGGDSFAGNWSLTTSVKANGSTASLGDPSGVGSSFGVSTTPRNGGTFDDTRWWTTKKIVLPGLNVDTVLDRVSNPQATAQIAAAIESFEVDVNADFTGDLNVSNLGGDAALVRVRTYRNTASISSTTDVGFNDVSFINLLQLESTTPSTNGFQRFSGSAFALGSGVFAVDTTTPNNSDVAFRLELQLRRNNRAQTGEGVFFDNLAIRMRIGDTTVYNAPASLASASVDAASYVRATAPGQILAAFGTGFPTNTNITAAAPSVPLPTQLSNVTVRVNGVNAPLYFVGVGGGFGPGAFQINYQLPYETSPGIAFVEVLNNGTPVTSEFLPVVSNAPGVFTANASGAGQAAVQNQDFTPNGNPAVNPNAKPEARGRFLIVYANGQGGQLVNLATQQPLTILSGAAATFNPLYATATKPTVTIGGVAANVDFSGLAPGLVGLWQLNVQIPANAPTGNAVPLLVNFGGRTSAATTVAVN